MNNVLLQDGVYRVTHGGICAGFIVRGGRIVKCAPILKKQRAQWMEHAVLIRAEDTQSHLF